MSGEKVSQQLEDTKIELRHFSRVCSDYKEDDATFMHGPIAQMREYWHGDRHVSTAIDDYIQASKKNRLKLRSSLDGTKAQLKAKCASLQKACAEEKRQARTKAAKERTSVYKENPDSEKQD